jgi:hypothetical protein
MNKSSLLFEKIKFTLNTFNLFRFEKLTILKLQTKNPSDYIQDFKNYNILLL